MPKNLGNVDRFLRLVGAVAAGVCAAIAPFSLPVRLLVFAGIVQLVYAIQERGKDGFRFKILSAILTFLLGVFLLLRPMIGIASITLLIGAFFFASGVSSAIMAFTLKPKAGWGWVLFDGILSLAIALLIANGWPESSLSFIGLLVGIVMIYGGIWRIMLGRALRSAPA